MGQQGFQWREQWGLEGADMQYTCGAAATNARARRGGGGWSREEMSCSLNNNVLGLPVIRCGSGWRGSSTCVGRGREGEL